MALTNTTRLNITNGTSREEMEAFIAALPEHAQIEVETQVVKADRAYETDRVAVALKGEWEI